jgi:DUF971 family protein
MWSGAGGRRTLRIMDAHLVGAFGIGFDSNDGHGTGIYTWDVLRSWSEPTAD